jgi:hypothetical protein
VSLITVACSLFCSFFMNFICQGAVLLRIQISVYVIGFVEEYQCLTTHDSGLEKAFNIIYTLVTLNVWVLTEGVN